MAVFSAAVTATVTAIKALTFKAVVVGAAKFIGTSLLASGVSRLIAKRQMKKAKSGNFGGGRIQLPPATDNKIPVVYGSAFVGGPIIDAKISTDQKTMWYIIALAEHTDTTVGTNYTFGNEMYYDGKLVTFGTGAAVASLTNNNQGTAQVDTTVAGSLFIYLFSNGSSSGTNTGGQTAIQILQDSAIPVAQRWTSNNTMTNCAFAIVKVIYNNDAGLTNLGSLTVRLVNNLTKPGDVLKDYMLNTRYGCAIPLSRIDTDSLDDLNDYSDELITYVPVGGGSATKPRYTINGPIDTANDCLTNLQILVDSCDSWLQYSELTGKWKVVINQSYTDYTTINDLFLVDDSNLVSGIQINPIDLNQTYNELEVAYPNFFIKDQTDYQTIKLSDYQAGLMSPNEAVNRLDIDLPVVNNAVQAKYIGLRRLLESREDLTVSFQMDYSGIQIEAGDVIKINSTVYGWTEKLFRVSNVAEEKYPDGTLGASIQAFEYNDTIYADNSIEDFQPAFNTGLTDPNIISQPGKPVLTVNPLTDGQVKSFNVSSTVPTTGTVLYMDFNYGFTSNVVTHRLYRTVSKNDGTPFTAGENVNFDVNDAGPATYYVSTVARNDHAGRSSVSSDPFVWDGMNITESEFWDACNASSSGNLVTSDAIANLLPGGLVTVVSGTGTLAANTIVANVISSTQFTLNQIPTVALANACIEISLGGVSNVNIQTHTVTSNNMVPTGVVPGSYNNTNLTVDAAGRITLATSGGAATPAPFVNATTAIFGSYDAVGGTAGTFANAFATVFRNQSLNIPGGIQYYNNNNSIDTTTYSVGTNDWDPWLQNSASTTDGFLANSTARATPKLTQYQKVSVFNNAGTQFLGAGDGHLGWINIGSGAAPGGANISDQFYYTGTFNLMALQDCNVQIGGATRYANLPTDLGYILDWGTVKTIELIANRPEVVNMNFYSEGSFINNTTPVFNMGTFVRNTDSGTILLVSRGNWLILEPTFGPAPGGFTE